MEENKKLIPEFEELIETLKPDLQLVETMRKKKLMRLFIAAGISILFLVVLYITIGKHITGNAYTIVVEIILPLLLIGGGGFYIWYSSSSVCEEYKRTIIAPFAENLVENGIYSPTEGIPESTFLKSNLYQTPDRYNSEDLIKGKIGQTSILFSEVHAEEKYQTTDSKGNTKTHWRDIFRGFMFVADFPKEFEVPITIKRKKLFASKKNSVFLEDPEFEKCFNVYCNDQIQARYILTASLMRRIMDLERKFHGKKMMLSFHDNNVIITIQEKTNHYEAGLWRSVIRNKKLRREYEIIRAFALIVEDLNLNLRIWTKQV